MSSMKTTSPEIGFGPGTEIQPRPEINILQLGMTYLRGRVGEITSGSLGEMPVIGKRKTAIIGSCAFIAAGGMASSSVEPIHAEESTSREIKTAYGSYYPPNSPEAMERADYAQEKCAPYGLIVNSWLSNDGRAVDRSKRLGSFEVVRKNVNGEVRQVWTLTHNKGYTLCGKGNDGVTIFNTDGSSRFLNKTKLKFKRTKNGRYTTTFVDQGVIRGHEGDFAEHAVAFFKKKPTYTKRSSTRSKK